MITAASARLLRAILADPADDTARLAYSDALEEEGQDERAEFVRVQVGLERDWPSLYQQPKETRGCFPTGPADEWGECAALQARELDLYKRLGPAPLFGPAWWGLPPSLLHLGSRPTPDPADKWGVYTLRRGFVAEVSCPAAAFVEHAAALFAAHPVERVTLTDRKPGVRFLLSNGFDNGGWIWGRASDYSPTPAAWPHHLPKPLWEVMAARGAEGPFADQQLALDALARVCVAYGRHLAGLPALD